MGIQTIRHSNCHQTLYSNVDTIDQADIILLAEKHRKKGHLLKNAALIEQMYRKGDIISVENDRTLLVDKTYLQISYINAEVNAIGWDIPRSPLMLETMALTSETGRVVTEGLKSPDWENLIEKLQHYINTKKEEITPKALTNYIMIILNDKEMVNKTTQEKLEIAKRFIDTFSKTNLSNLAKLNFNDVASLEEKKKVTTLLMDFVCKIFTLLACSEADERAIERNQSLIQTIDENLKGGKRRIFVISGRGHVDFLKTATENQKEAVKQLHTYLKDKKFVILNPKSMKAIQAA